MTRKKVLISISLVILLLPARMYSQKHEKFYGRILLKENWQVQQSSKAGLTGADITATNMNTDTWHMATVPSTVMGVLTGNGLYKDIFSGNKYSTIDKKQFDDSWWYRKQFETPAFKQGDHIYLNFDGINYYANIWLNGRLIASRDSVYGTFRRFSFDITNLLTSKTNVLAIELFRAQPGDFNLGFVDWNPRPVDENMGIWREVYLEVAGKVSINNTYVESKVNTLTLEEAELTIKTTLQNNSPQTITGNLTGKIEDILFSLPVNLIPGKPTEIILTPANIPELRIRKPRLWWCNNLGSPELYTLNLSFETGKQVSASENITFGIREIECYTNPAGHKGYKLNGKEVLIKGAGWTDDIFLRDSLASLETQVQYVKHMNLNTLRFESIWGTNQDIYNLCDKYGILAMVGWSCQWEWDEYLGKTCDEFGGIQTEQEMNLILTSFRDQVLWLRNHPSIFVWMVGSDKCPKPELEKRYASLLKTLDNRPYLASAGTRISTVSGPTGVKMNGPYEYVSPNYWYIDTINGGAFGFNTETGPGPQVPILESVKKMIPEDKLWPLNDTWSYHCTHSKQAFNTMDVFNQALNARFGKPETLENYLLKSDAQSYEALKAMFEAFRVNIPKSTGIIQWMLNSAWPSLYWHLYDYYLRPSAAYYAARTANEPVQLMYNYSNNSVYAVNETRQNITNWVATLTVMDINSKMLVNKKLTIDILSNSSKNIFKLDPVKGFVFLDMRLEDEKGNRVGGNFYWLSDKPDELDWDKTTWAYTPMKSYTDFSALNQLPASSISVANSLEETADKKVIHTLVSNTSDKIAFFVSLSLIDSKGESYCPVFWDDNYFSLLPGETREVKCTMDKSILETSNPKLQISGWNSKTQILSIN